MGIRSTILMNINCGRSFFGSRVRTELKTSISLMEIRIRRTASSGGGDNGKDAAQNQSKERSELT